MPFAIICMTGIRMVILIGLTRRIKMPTVNRLYLPKYDLIDRPMTGGIASGIPGKDRSKKGSVPCIYSHWSCKALSRFPTRLS